MSILGGTGLVMAHEMKNSAALRPTAAIRRLQRDGFLLLRDVIPADEVMAARRAVLDLLVSEGSVSAESLVHPHL
jgi:hypothetical protein